MILELTSEEVVRNLRLAVHDIDWSVRTISCLGNGGIKYVWQLVQCSERDLLMLKNFGRKSLILPPVVWLFLRQIIKKNPLKYEDSLSIYLK